MANGKSIYVSIENPTLKQRFLVYAINTLLWMVIRLYSDDSEKRDNEIKDLLHIFHSNV